MHIELLNRIFSNIQLQVKHLQGLIQVLTDDFHKLEFRLTKLEQLKDKEPKGKSDGLNEGVRVEVCQRGKGWSKEWERQNPKEDVFKENPLGEYFELSYAQFLTVPRLVMESMSYEWQSKMKDLLMEMDETFDWRPKEGRYWVRLRDDRGRFSKCPHWDYRRGNIDHLRIK